MAIPSGTAFRQEPEVAKFHHRDAGRVYRRARQARRLTLELLEDRTVPSGASFQPQLLVFHAPGTAVMSYPSPPLTAFNPASLDQAYGINNAVIGDGTGETIAVIDAYDDPKFVSRSPTLGLLQDTAFLASDLHQFDLQYNLPEPPGFFTKVNQFGGTVYPGTDPAGVGNINWEAEEALDVEWAHAMAPGAHILLVEAIDSGDNLFSAAGWAGTQGGAATVSMSFSGSEDTTEVALDPIYFTSPAGHGVTYLAASGDNGATGSGHQPDGYPAYSPDVVAVGGTLLQVSGGNYSSETGWSGSGGGISLYESKPAYQSAVTQSATNRTAPDIAFDAAPSSGVAVYDSYNGGLTPWYQFGGTSLATPCWAGLITIADQMRASQGLPSLDGPSQTLPTLYNLATVDFHDITTGNNGYAAGQGYDLVTGLGSPVPGKLLPDLAGLWVSASLPGAGTTVGAPPTTFTLTFSDPVSPNGLSAAAFKVNGIPASTVSLDATDTLATFTYPSSPVTTPGSQTMSLAAGWARQLDNSATASLAYTGKFNFDPLALAVTSTNPGVGGTIPVPASSITFTVNFNEAFDPAGVGVGNLTVSQGIVTAARPLVGNQSIAYTINGLTTPATLTVTLPAGTLKDQYEFTSVASFSGSYNLVGPHLVINAPANVTAGSGFLFTLQAQDAFNNPISNFSGLVNFTATDPQGSLPGQVMVSGGFGYFIGALKTVAGGPWTITATSGLLSAVSQPISVTPSAPVKLSFGTQPANTPTGIALAPVTVNILDAYGNVVTSDSSDSVTLGIAAAAGPGGFAGGSTSTVTAVAGVATFANLTLVVPGTYQFSEFVAGSYTGPNSSTFAIAPLQVVPGSFAGDPWGFSLSFNTAYLVNSLTPVLYGQGTGVAPSITVTQTRDGNGNPVDVPVVGSLVLNSSANAITFVATNTGLEVANDSPLLPDGTYSVVVHATAAGDGFEALNPGGGFLDGLETGTPGSGDYTATFTVHAAGADVLWIPATADGPGQALNAPGMNQAGGGYPVYLNDSTGTVTSVQVTLDYNPALLAVTGVTGADFTLLGTSTPGQAILQYSGPALQVGKETPIGFVTASVPGGRAATPMPYRAKELLHLSDALLNGGSITAVTGDALHLVAYLGDGDGNGAYTSNDAVLVTRVAIQADTGFAAYPLVDPVIVADTDGSGFIPADAALQVNEAGVGFANNNLPSPPIPGGVFFQPIANNVDPTLSIPTTFAVSADGTVPVPVHLDNAHPQGSTGLIEAHLALVYNPGQFTVSAADVHLGSIPSSGSGWSLSTTINPLTGQIAIALSSTVPITQPIGGSLVTIDMHAVGRIANPNAPPIFLVASVNPTGQQLVPTELEDEQGTFTLSSALSGNVDPLQTFNGA
jgi:hypothetical protein